MRNPFKKIISPEFDRITITANGHDDWLHITMHVGRTVTTVEMTLRSDEAVRDLHYALSRYLSHIGDE